MGRRTNSMMWGYLRELRDHRRRAVEEKRNCVGTTTEGEQWKKREIVLGPSG